MPGAESAQGRLGSAITSCLPKTVLGQDHRSPFSDLTVRGFISPVCHSCRYSKNTLGAGETKHSFSTGEFSIQTQSSQGESHRSGRDGKAAWTRVRLQAEQPQVPTGVVDPCASAPKGKDGVGDVAPSLGGHKAVS